MTILHEYATRVWNYISPRKTQKARDKPLQFKVSTIQAKPKFDKLFIGPLILLNLGLVKEATDKFSAAIIDKVPAAYQSLANQIVAPIDTAFVEAIVAYEGL